MPDTPMTPEAMRADMPIAGQIAYFDHAAVGPLSGPATRAVAKWLEQASRLGDTVWPEWRKSADRARRDAAGLIHADTDEIALVTSTTMGINFVAEGIDWREGDNAVILADEYPSNAYPWMHQRDRGVETRLVPTDGGRVDFDKLREACDARTRVVSASWVGFATGYRQPVEKLLQIAHDAGALFFLDAIQGLGVLPLDVSQLPIDFLAADGHKWQLGPEGAGMAFIRREHLEKLRAIGVGSGSVVDRYNYSELNYQIRPDASRYEGGSPNMVGYLGWGASLALLRQWRPADIERAILDVTDLACERLQSIGAVIASHRAIEPDGHDPRSGIVSFELPGRDPMALREKCLAAGVALSCRGGRLRLAAHAYNDASDIERLAEALK